MDFLVQLYPWDRWPDLPSIAKVVQASERLGFAGITFSEHLVTPLTGEIPPIGRSWPEIYVVAGYLAGMTERIRFVFYATVVPYRAPIHQAKLISTLDQVSGGRLTVVVGAGWLEEEFDALGIPFARRGDRTDEYLRAMRVLWTEDEPSFDGEFVSFAPVAFEPKCAQSPHVPLWIGGSGPRPERRVTEFGCGWAPMVGTVDELAADIRRVKESFRASGRDPSTLDFAFGMSFGRPDPLTEAAASHVSSASAVETRGGSAEETIVLIERYRAAGFTTLNVSTDWETPDDYVTKLEWFAEHVMATVAASPRNGSVRPAG